MHHVARVLRSENPVSDQVVVWFQSLLNVLSSSYLFILSLYLVMFWKPKLLTDWTDKYCVHKLKRVSHRFCMFVYRAHGIFTKDNQEVRIQEKEWRGSRKKGRSRSSLPVMLRSILDWENVLCRNDILLSYLFITSALCLAYRIALRLERITITITCRPLIITFPTFNTSLILTDTTSILP